MINIWLAVIIGVIVIARARGLERARGEQRESIAPAGRLPRGKFFLYSVGTFLIYDLAWKLTAPSKLLLAVAVGLIASFFQWTLIIEREHDRGNPAIHALWALVPFYGLVLIFSEGTIGPNKFGPDPVRRKTKEDSNSEEVDHVESTAVGIATLNDTNQPALSRARSFLDSTRMPKY